MRSRMVGTLRASAVGLLATHRAIPEGEAEVKLRFSLGVSVLATLASQLELGLLGGEKPLFELRTGPFVGSEFVVLEVHGTEALSQLFRFEVLVASLVESSLDLEGLAEQALGGIGSSVAGSIGGVAGALGSAVSQLVGQAEASALEMLLVGQPATLVIHSLHAPPRVVQGVCSELERLGPTGGESSDWQLYRLVIRPRLWFTTLRRNSRVFQEITVQTIVSEILNEHGIAHRWTHATVLPPRVYTVQHQETDYSFIKRLLAELGLFYFFEPPSALVESLLGGSALGAVAHAGQAFGGALGQVADAVGLTETLVIGEGTRSYIPIASQDGNEFLGAALGAAELAAEGGGATTGRVTGGLQIDSSGIHLNASARGAVGTAANMARGLLANNSPQVVFQELSGLRRNHDHVFQFGIKRVVRPKSATLKEYDYNRPTFNLSAHAKANLQLNGSLSGFTNVNRSLAFNTDATAPTPIRTGPLEMYDHHDEYQETDVDRDHARIHLEQHRRDSRVAAGQSVCQRLIPGYRFRLEDHPVRICNNEFAVIQVEHWGRIPEWAKAIHGDSEAVPSSKQNDVQELNYRNRFRCVPAGIVYRLPRPPRRLWQTVETATVVGPPGHELHVDEQGRIRIQFHWDRIGALNERSSCWIRVMQPWGGAGWGHQFIPRVGMEVVVSFLGGDPDKPVVLGSLYNGTHPAPFPVPSAARSGIRTRSTPHSDGYHELSFDDAVGNEQIHLRSQRDFAAEILRNSTTQVGVNQEESVGGDKRGTVKGSVNQTVGANRDIRVNANDTLEVAGDRTTRVSGSVRTSVARDVYLKANESIREFERSRETVSGTSDINVEQNLTTRVKGCWTTVVGAPEDQRSATFHVEGRIDVYSAEQLELLAEKRLVLRCGDSTLTLTPKGVEICAPSFSLRGKELHMESDAGAKIALSDEATVAAAKIQLKSNKPVPGEEEPDTEIELVDQEGAPIELQRFLIMLKDGTEISGVTDKEGKATVRNLPEDAEIVFPDLSKGE